MPIAHRSALPVAAFVAATLCMPSFVSAQRARTAAPVSATPTATTWTAANPAYDPALYTSPTATERAFKSLRWRSIGPYRGGRVDAVVGDLHKPFLFYMGSVNGGVWRTTNGGQTWENLTDGKSDI